MRPSAVLLEEYKRNRVPPFKVRQCKFDGTDGRDVYNITAPFLLNGELIIAGRVEPRENEESEVFFFSEKDRTWTPKKGAMKLQMQDPFFTFVNGELIIGGVQTFQKPDGMLGWRTIFYRGFSLSSLKHFFTGPDGMKDLRIVQLANGTIGVLTRPQGEKGGRGSIGYINIERLDFLTVSVIADAPLLTNRFTDDEWGGSNEIHVLKDGTLGVLGHIGSFDDPAKGAGNRHYYAMTFQINPLTSSCSDVRLLAVRSDFLPSEPKRPDLADVVFSGGLVRRSNGVATLYVGIGDSDAQYMNLIDPFIGL